MHTEIDSITFAVSIFADGEIAPLIFQPTHPDNTPFTSVEDAQDWATTFLASYETQSPPASEQLYALVSNGIVTAIVPPDTNVEDAVNDKILPLPDGIVVGASWTQIGGFVNP